MTSVDDEGTTPSRLFPVGLLIKFKEELQCIHPDEPVKRALELMIERNYSQLPIIRDERLTGIISHKKIVTDLCNGISEILTAPVSRYEGVCPQVSMADDIFGVAEMLNDESAIVVVEDGKPVGIITDWDVTQYFHDASHVRLRTHAIERVMREQLDKVGFPLLPDIKGKVPSINKGCEQTLRYWDKVQAFYDPNQLDLRRLFTKAVRQVIITRDRIDHIKVDELEFAEVKLVKLLCAWFDQPQGMDVAHKQELEDAVAQYRIEINGVGRSETNIRATEIVE